MTPPKEPSRILRWRQGPRLTIRIIGQYKNFYFSTTQLAVRQLRCSCIRRWRHSSRISKYATEARGAWWGGGGWGSRDRVHRRVENINQKCMPKASLSLPRLPRSPLSRWLDVPTSSTLIVTLFAHLLRPKTHRYSLTRAQRPLQQFKAFNSQHPSIPASSIQHP